ncbi:MAG: hypothetical protein KVP17_003196 [Porospora cf. gigantea B]|nr:MAG: hypothetical protein KVP17_003196 [Porospora cf. gigantea B]
MRGTIENAPFGTTLTLVLDPQESVSVAPGTMIAMSGVSLKETSASSKLKMMKGQFRNIFQSGRHGGWICLAASAPGDIVEMPLGHGAKLNIKAGQVLAHTTNVSSSSVVDSRGIFSNGGMLMKQYKAEGPASLWVSAFGSVKPITMDHSQAMIVDNSNLLAYDNSVNYDMVKVGGGFRSALFGGEGLACSFTGKGVVYVQSHSTPDFAATLAPYIQN